jgi:hypothetical protein
LKHEAISYVWGDPERAHTLLPAGDVASAITASLPTALPYLAAWSKTGNSWIDQICVNQADVAERNSEVPKMGTVHEGATRVIAYLDEDGSDTRLIQEIIETAREAPREPGTSQYYKRLYGADTVILSLS